MSIRVLNHPDNCDVNITLAATANAAKRHAEWLTRLSRNRQVLDRLGNIVALLPESCEPPAEGEGRLLVLRYIGSATSGKGAKSDLDRIQRLLDCRLQKMTEGDLIGYVAHDVKIKRMTVSILIEAPWVKTKAQKAA